MSVVRVDTLNYNTAPTLRTMPTATFPMSIRLQSTERESLAEFARLEKRSVSALVTEAIRDMIARKGERMAWLKSCEEADRHMEETGLHVTHAEVMSWLDSLATPQPLATPQCHR